VVGYALSAEAGSIRAALPIFADGTAFENDEAKIALRANTKTGVNGL
jgi:hypothetical protein